MGLQTVPGYIGQAAYLHPVELDRNIMAGIHGRTGVMKLGDFAITPTGVAQQISIAKGRAFLLGVESNQQGGYTVWSDVAENQVFGAPSGSARIDTLIQRVVDTQYGSDPGSPRAEWAIYAGTPSGSPVALADSVFNSGGINYKPGAWWRVADVRINVGDTVIPDAQITRFLRYTRLSRGHFLARSTDSIADMVAGDSRFDTDTLTDRTWDGTTWQPSSQIMVDAAYVTAGTVANSTGASEVAIPAASWAGSHEPIVNFRDKHIYRVNVTYGISVPAGTSTAITVRLRKGSATIAGLTVGIWRDAETTLHINQRTHDCFIKNTSGANINTNLSLTIQRISAANDAALYGDAGVPLNITVTDLGLESGHKASIIATAIT